MRLKTWDPQKKGECVWPAPTAPERRARCPVRSWSPASTRTPLRAPPSAALMTGPPHRRRELYRPRSLRRPCLTVFTGHARALEFLSAFWAEEELNAALPSAERRARRRDMTVRVFAG